MPLKKISLVGAYLSGQASGSNDDSASIHIAAEFSPQPKPAPTKLPVVVANHRTLDRAYAPNVLVSIGVPRAEFRAQAQRDGCTKLKNRARGAKKH